MTVPLGRGRKRAWSCTVFRGRSLAASPALTSAPSPRSVGHASEVRQGGGGRGAGRELVQPEGRTPRWGTRGRVPQGRRGPAALTEGSRGSALGVQPIGNLGNCALMTLRSSLGFRETYVCLMSPERPQLLGRGATCSQPEERFGFIPGRVHSIGEHSQPLMVSSHSVPNTAPRYDATSESNSMTPLNKQRCPRHVF